MTLSSPHEVLVSQKVVPLYYKEIDQSNQVVNFTLTEAVLQMASAIFTVRHLNVSSYSQTQEDTFFVMYNSFNDFLMALQSSCDYYLAELSDRATQKDNLLLTLFLCSLGIILLSIPILFPAVNSVNRTKDKVLALFIEIPNSYITELAKRSETFVNSFYDEGQDEMKSIDEHSSIMRNGGIEFGSELGLKRNIMKQPRNSSNDSQRFFIQFITAVLIIIAYFTSTFVIAKYYISNLQTVT